MDESEEPPPAPEPPKKGGKGILLTIVAVLLLTLAGAGGGGMLGITLAGTIEEATRKKAEAEAAAGRPVASRYTGETHLVPLKAMVTNLASPKDTWIRIEASLVLADDSIADVDLFAAEISGDLTAYLRTLTAAQVEGASGFQHLREDLDERVAIRSEGKVSELIVHSLVIQ